MNEKRFGAMSSSVNPKELSTTLQGVMRLVAGIAVSFGIFEATEANTVVEQVMTLVPLGYAAWNSGEILFGILRKVIVRLFERK